MVKLDQIAAHLGVATPDAESVQGRQWLEWIGQARELIEERADDLGRTYDEERADRVVLLAVVKMARRPTDETQVDVAVDDARVSRRYSSSTGEVTISDEWWRRLGLVPHRGAFNVRLTGQSGFAPRCRP